LAPSQKGAEPAPRPLVIRRPRFQRGGIAVSMLPNHAISGGLPLSTLAHSANAPPARRPATSAADMEMVPSTSNYLMITRSIVNLKKLE
jgi:hypothetical protein